MPSPRFYVWPRGTTAGLCDDWEHVRREVAFWLQDGTPVRVANRAGQIVWDSAHGAPLPDEPPMA